MLNTNYFKGVGIITVSLRVGAILSVSDLIDYLYLGICQYLTKGDLFSAVQLVDINWMYLSSALDFCWN